MSNETWFQPPLWSELEEDEVETSQETEVESLEQLKTRLEQLRGRLDHLAVLSDQLAKAKEDRRLRIFCWETEDGFFMDTTARPTPGFFGMTEKIPNPIPEGAHRISVEDYQRGLEKAIAKHEERLEEIEEEIHDLESDWGMSRYFSW